MGRTDTSTTAPTRRRTSPWRALSVVAAFLLAFAAPSSTTRAQSEDESELLRVQREQGRVRLRLSSLREKMGRLADRYESEGRDRNSQLLREAMRRFDESDLLERSREIEQSLEGKLLATIEQQDGLTTSLESLYSVLRDRRDVDELRSRVDLVTEALGELDHLAEDQRRLLSQTRSATDSSTELVEEASEAAERLQRSLESATEAAEQLERIDDSLGEASVADRLAREQRVLSNREDATAGEQASLEQRVAELIERLEQPLGDVGPSEIGEAAQRFRDEARQAAEGARRAMGEAREQLSDAQSGERGSEGAPRDGSGRSGDSERDGTSERGANDSSGEPSGSSSRPSDDASQPSGESTTSSADEQTSGDSGSEPTESRSGDESATGSPRDGATSSESASDPSGRDGSAESDSPSSSERDPTAAESAPAGERAAESAREGETPEPSDDPRSTAQSEMARAADLLEEARDALLDAERTLAASRNRTRAMGVASARQSEERASELEDLSQRLETLQPDEGPELLDRTRELIRELSEMAAALEQGRDPSGAQQNAQAAQLQLNDILRQLQARAAGAGEGQQPSEGLDEGQLAAMAESQAELERRVRELMDRLSELPDQGFQRPAEQAAGAMDQAAERLRSGQTGEAAGQQEEAAEKLEEARDQLAGERDRYEQLRQDEVLFRLEEELRSLLDRQAAIGTETREIDDARGDRDRLSRSHRRAVARLADEQQDLGRRTDEVKQELEQDGAVAFVFALSQTRDDMSAAATRLSDEETGIFVQSLHESVEQRLADLLAVLEDEMERRREAMREQDGQEQQQQAPPPDGKPPLVPPVAELLLIQRMELMALSRLDSFREQHPELDAAEELGPIERELLERWALEHTSVTELFESLVPKPPEAPLEIEGPVDGVTPPEGTEDER